MSASPTSAAVPSQKRPLEEPSSPGAGDQPEAKRPALDNMVNADQSTTIDTPVHAGSAGDEPAAIDNDATTTVQPALNGSAEHTTDTVLPDAPANLDTSDAALGSGSALQAIQSTASSQAVLSQPVGDQKNESTWLHVRSVISSQEAATVIGKGGENVTIIRHRSGARCTVSDYARGAVERILTVSGPVDAVSKVSPITCAAS